MRKRSAKMKIKVLNTSGTEMGETELPIQFQEPLRIDLVKKAVLAIQNNRRQAYGAYKEAGKRHHVEVSRKRRDYKTSYGHGISRVPRKVLSHRGSQFFWVGDFAPGTVGGRKAHPPKAEKIFKWKINEKERRKAICSAMSAVMNKDVVAERGHALPKNYPFLITEEFEEISKTKELLKTLVRLGFEQELRRAANTRIRAGKGKRRGRRKALKKSLLLVVANRAKIGKAAANASGLDCVCVQNLNAELLAPGGHVGRATLFTTKSLEALKKNLFTDYYKGTSEKRKSPEKGEAVKEGKLVKAAKENKNKTEAKK
jgi:large subunit ribosomal protein L4e